MIRGLVCALAMVSVLATARSAHACAGCRNPSLPTSRGSEGPLPEQAWALGVSLSGTTVNVVHEAGCRDVADCDEVPAQPAYMHDQGLYPIELRASVEYGVTALLGVELQVPFRMVATTIEYTTPAGAAYEPLDRDVHHRDELVAGLADPWLLLRIGHSFDGVWLAVRPGFSVPLGSTEKDPFELGDQGLQHQHIQLGTGTFDPLLVLEASIPVAGMQLQLFAQGVLPLYENSYGYRAPWRVQGGTAVVAELLKAFSGKLGIEVLHEAEERWQGVVRQDGSLGRSELGVLFGVAYGLGASSFSLDVRVPFVRHIVVGDEAPGTISSPLALALRFDHIFGSEPKP